MDASSYSVHPGDMEMMRNMAYLRKNHGMLPNTPETVKAAEAMMRGEFPNQQKYKQLGGPDNPAETGEKNTRQRAWMIGLSVFVAVILITTIYLSTRRNA